MHPVRSADVVASLLMKHGTDWSSGSFVGRLAAS